MRICAYKPDKTVERILELEEKHRNDFSSAGCECE